MREKKEEEWGERKKKETRGNDSRVRKQSNTGSVQEMEMVSCDPTNMIYVEKSIGFCARSLKFRLTYGIIIIKKKKMCKWDVADQY